MQEWPFVAWARGSRMLVHGQRGRGGTLTVKLCLWVCVFMSYQGGGTGVLCTKEQQKDMRIHMQMEEKQLYKINNGLKKISSITENCSFCFWPPQIQRWGRCRYIDTTVGQLACIFQSRDHLIVQFPSSFFQQETINYGHVFLLNIPTRLTYLNTRNLPGKFLQTLIAPKVILLPLAWIVTFNCNLCSEQINWETTVHSMNTFHSWIKLLTTL